MMHNPFPFTYAQCSWCGRSRDPILMSRGGGCQCQHRRIARAIERRSEVEARLARIRRELVKASVVQIRYLSMHPSPIPPGVEIRSVGLVPLARSYPPPKFSFYQGAW